MDGRPGEAFLTDGTAGGTYPLSEPRWRSDAGRPLDVSGLSGTDRAGIDRSERSIWRYRAALPLPGVRPVSLGEGGTPLVARPFRGRPALFKLEWASPTGSFKDRGASAMISALRAQGVSEIVEDSSGNGGAAIAAYGAAAGMEVHILCPEGTGPAKLAQIAATGARVRLVPGPREAAADAALGMAERGVFYASHNWHPFFLQGTKTLGYELWEQLGFRAPDCVVVPAGAGSNVLGCDKAFAELRMSGEIDRLPRIYAAQPANCAPVDAAFRAGAEDFVSCKTAPSVAEGAQIARPVRLRAVLAALRRSGGGTVAVPEADIAAAARDLAAGGLYAEPTAALAAAALDRLLAAGAIGAEETAVAVLTGGGLKAGAWWAAEMGLG